MRSRDFLVDWWRRLARAVEAHGVVLPGAALLFTTAIVAAAVVALASGGSPPGRAAVPAAEADAVRAPRSLPGERATVSIADAGNAAIDVTLPPALPSEPLTLRFRPLAHRDFDRPAGDQPAAMLPAGVPVPRGSTGGASVVSVFELSATTADGVRAALGAPVSLAVAVSPEVLAQAGGDLRGIELRRYDESAGRWRTVECAPAARGMLQCTASGLSLWAIVVVSPLTPRAAPIAPATGHGPLR